jgi:acetyl esterase/lipase
MAEDTRQALRRIGRAFTPETIETVNQLFALLHRANGYEAPRIDRDLRYGPDPRHRLDVHTPADRAVAAPVLLFVHGGGFVGGDKHDPELPYYDHVGGWAARHGMVGVTMTYRLAPQHPWPAGAQDIAGAVDWTRSQIADHGGDPDRIVLAGHSAGAAHVATYVAGHGGPGADDLAAAVMLSGIYDLGTAEHNELLPLYFGADETAYPERSALPGLVASRLPMLFSVAELDLPDFHRQASVVLDALFRRDGVLPPFAWVPGHTHLSEILSLGVDEEALGAVLWRFVEQATARVPAT